MKLFGDGDGPPRPVLSPAGSGSRKAATQDRSHILLYLARLGAAYALVLPIGWVEKKKAATPA